MMNTLRPFNFVLSLFIVVAVLASCRDFYMYRFHLVTPKDSEVALPTVQLLPIAVNIIQSEQYECTYWNDERPDLENPGHMRHVEGHYCVHPHHDGFVVHVRVENGSIVYQIAKSSPRAPNKKAEE